MTDTQMVMVPKVATDEMQNIDIKFTCGGFLTYQDVFDAMIQASPNQGKVTKEMVEECQKAVDKVILTNRENRDLLVRAVIKTLKLEVEG